MITPTQNLTILHDTQEWSTEIEGSISEIKVDGKTIGKSTKKSFITGMCVGVFASLSGISICIYTWVSMANIGVYKKNSHQVLSREGVMMLEQQGVGWNEEKRMWVNSFGNKLATPAQVTVNKRIMP